MNTIIPAANISGSALQAERTRLEVVAQNIANMHTTKGADGKVYRRKLVSFESVMQNNGTKPGTAVRVARVAEDKKPLVRAYMPGHPHADADGMVTMPNVNLVEEMADMLTASRSYEANLQVLKSAKQMVNGSMEIGAVQ